MKPDFYPQITATLRFSLPGPHPLSTFFAMLDCTDEYILASQIRASNKLSLSPPALKVGKDGRTVTLDQSENDVASIVYLVHSEITKEQSTGKPFTRAAIDSIIPGFSYTLHLPSSIHPSSKKHIDNVYCFLAFPDITSASSAISVLNSCGNRVSTLRAMSKLEWGLKCLEYKSRLSLAAPTRPQVATPHTENMSGIPVIADPSSVTPLKTPAKLQPQRQPGTVCRFIGMHPQSTTKLIRKIIALVTPVNYIDLVESACGGEGYVQFASRWDAYLACSYFKSTRVVQTHKDCLGVLGEHLTGDGISCISVVGLDSREEKLYWDSRMWQFDCGNGDVVGKRHFQFGTEDRDYSRHVTFENEDDELMLNGHFGNEYERDVEDEHVKFGDKDEKDQTHFKFGSDDGEVEMDDVNVNFGYEVEQDSTTAQFGNLGGQEGAIKKKRKRTRPNKSKAEFQ